jgi:hypothetical protein
MSDRHRRTVIDALPGHLTTPVVSSAAYNLD